MVRNYQPKPRLLSHPAVPDARRQRPVTRAFPEGTEVLTEHGFYLFEDLLNDDLFDSEVQHEGVGLPQSWKVKDLPYTLYKPNASFPRVASVDTSTGEVIYAAPSLFRTFVYDGLLAQLKMKGVDILSTAHADLVLKNRYGRAYNFLIADNVSRGREGQQYYLLDKFDQDLYGEYQPRQNLHVRLDAPITLHPTRHSHWLKIDDVYPFVSIDASGRKLKVDRARTEINTFNLDVEPFHTLIVRRGRKDNNPRTPWIGNPIVVGDGSDKSIMRVNKLLALKGNTP